MLQTLGGANGLRVCTSRVARSTRRRICECYSLHALRGKLLPLRRQLALVGVKPVAVRRQLALMLFQLVELCRKPAPLHGKFLLLLGNFGDLPLDFVEVLHLKLPLLLASMVSAASKVALGTGARSAGSAHLFYAAFAAFSCAVQAHAAKTHVDKHAHRLNRPARSGAKLLQEMLGPGRGTQMALRALQPGLAQC